MKTRPKKSSKTFAKEHAFKFRNGEQVKDAITGLLGYIVYRVDNITGCNQYGVQPADIDSIIVGTAITEMKDIRLIDENRLISTKQHISLPTEEEEDRGPVATEKAINNSRKRKPI